MTTDSNQTLSPARAEDTIITYFHETFRQHVLQKTAYEFLGGQGALPFLTRIRVSIAECHLIVFQIKEAMIADGHAETCPESVEGM